MRAIMEGVEKTRRVPLPIAAAVFVSSAITVSVCLSGISLLATGYIDEKTFKYRGEQTEFWYSVHAGYGVDMLGTDKAKGFRIYTDEKYIKTATLTKVAYYPKKTAFPIRCVMDKE